ncbi:transcription termination factor 2 [Nannizzia gypsea CBS 118893]|uniref:Transcription termination factor 2 n=1 Tax=Arthroderma gypseum (strain ATCC MYA-4604 / CBS 118893) TaxID=535722 RepID=E4UQY9_ARTGP|nr:transcription termination factor 2 [Nannizzia gypsea CBS 118893]EFQ99315.1 transcription termination factor 2 [Nannizzia gypsea CBS 118893]
MSYPSAALLLDPKAYKRQSTTGNFSPSNHQPKRGCAMDGDQAVITRHLSEPPISQPVAPPSISRKRKAIDDFTLFTISDTYTYLKGRSTSRNNSKPSDSQGPTPAGAPQGTSFDPKLLLQPRQYKFPTRPLPNTNNGQDPNSSSHSRDEIKTPTNTNTAVLVTENEQLDSNKSPVAHSNMIEDIYGVERRESQPQKRVKIDKGPSTSSNGGPEARFSATGSSALGSYMKEKPDDISATVTASNPIDLTADKDDKNDDDVIFVANKEKGAEEVCYGKVEGATVHAHMIPALPKSAFGATTSSWPSIRCQLIRTRSNNVTIDVRDVAGKSFGVIDKHVSTALAPLLDMTFGLRTQARLDARRRKPDEQPGQACSEIFRISINLYGPRRVADTIGRVLSQKNIWLGIPNSVEAGIATYNPHAERRRLLAATAQQQQPQQTPRYTVQSEVRTAEEISSAVTKMFDQLQSAQNLPETETPELLKTQLLPHQKQALGFMVEKEKIRKISTDEAENNSLWRIEQKGNDQRVYREIISGVTLVAEPPQVLGGLLADMMGLGKTLSILSLVCSSLPDAAAWASQKSAQPSLINAKTTLLVSPLSAVGNWVSQIKEHVKDDALSFYVFHGPSRTEDPRELAKYDVVITTYTTILSDVSGKSSKRGTSPLVRMNMFRIVLDEAHIIREQNAAQSQAIFQLNAQRRWSVTGTPIQNRLEDLGAVLKFLRLSPYDERGRFAAHIVSPFKTENPSAITNLRVLVDSFTLRRVKDRINLPPRHDKTVMLNFTEQERRLHDFFKKESNVMMNVVASETRGKATGKMYHIVLKAMMVLRQICAHGKELLDKEDRERFRGLTANDAIDIEALDDDHSTTAASRKAYEMLSLMKESSADTCARCSNFITLQSDDSPGDKNAMVAAILPCYDILCADCFAPIAPRLDELAGKPVQVSCSFCNCVIAPAYSVITTAGFEEYQASLLENKKNRKQTKEFGQYEGPHTKTKALISRLLDTAEDNKKSSCQPPIKSVIFSAWTSHLDLIEVALEENKLTGFTRLDGTMSLKQRNASIETFSTDDSVTILLVTIGAGGVGLNLTAGSIVYIMEPQYNPAAIAQAVDRVHRIGQKREVTTIQFIMNDSIEEKITELAKRKQKLADMSLNRKMDRRELQKERLEEYRSLFK